ncbi:succinylglutamate desuccinylase [Arenicella sp. 4NH20-0111]|uniref:succinylglutamate desuccinylase n=1 Tax=Arenicella sp. 4NH20-0111 TaxID=3127648 RepID=UPI003104A5CA
MLNFLDKTLANPEYLPAQNHTLPGGVRLEVIGTGILRVRPAQRGDRRVIISCGVHGNETAPMEIVDLLLNEIEQGQLIVRNELLFIIGNPPAVNAESRFVEENLNRLFSGKHANSAALEASRARLLEEVVTDFYHEGDEPRLHYDLHTAIRGSQIEKFAVYPFLHSRNWSSEQLGFLEACGIEAALFSSQPSGTFSYFTSHGFDSDSFTIELGKVRKFGENQMSSFIKMIEGLKRVITGQESFEDSHQRIKLFSVVEEVIKRTDAFKLHVEADAKNFTEFKAGAILASDKGYEYRTQKDGERFVFPISNVPCGQRAMLVIAPTEI